MPNANQAVRFIGCTSASYAALGVYNQNTLYFCTDTQQIFLGDREYTKSIKVLDAQPTASTVGESGRLYVYNGNLYMCQVNGYVYTWTRIANVNDDNGTVVQVSAGAGLDGGTITESGTISHAVPSGATTRSDSTTDKTVDFGDTFKIVGITTDEFGHVTGVNLHNVTLPNETKLAVSGTVDTTETLRLEGTFEVVTEVEKGTGSHELQVKKKSYKLPAAVDQITYTLVAGEDSGSIKLIGSNGSTMSAIVKDWEKLAKVTDITSIFHYKGKKATIAQLPLPAAVGDVYLVEEKSTEYVYLGETEGWEEFGPTIDLTPYAKTAEVMPRVAGKEGKVAQFAADGTVVSSEHTLEKDVPADAVFTDTVFTHPSHTAHGMGLYKVQVDEQGHVSNATQVQKSDITDLGIPGENTDVAVTTTPNSTSKVYLAGSTSKDETTGGLKVNADVYMENGALTASAFHGKADSAGSADSATQAVKATQDGDGNVIKDTYATKQELSNSSTVWEVI